MKNVRKLVEGSVLLAAFIVMLLITVYVPIIGAVANLFLAVPFILFAGKNNWKDTAVFLIASILLSLIAGAALALPFALIYGATGVAIGLLMKNMKSMTTVYAISSLVFLLTLVTLYVGMVVFFQINVADVLDQSIKDSIDMSKSFLNQYGQDKANEDILKRASEGIGMIKTLLPTMFVLLSLVSVFLIQLVSVPIVKRFGIPAANWKPFREMNLPKSLLWYYMAVMLASLLLHPEKGTYLYTAILNLNFLLHFFMVFQGLTLVFSFFYWKGLPKSYSVIIMILTFVTPFFLSLAGILGIIDLGFGFKKKMEQYK